MREGAGSRLNSELTAVLAALTASLDRATVPTSRGALARTLDASCDAAHTLASRVLLDPAARAARGRGGLVAGALLLAALEAGFQLHRASAGALPGPARHAARPLGGALRAGRTVAWAAALTLAGLGLRRACARAAAAAVDRAGAVEAAGAGDEGGVEGRPAG